MERVLIHRLLHTKTLQACRGRHVHRRISRPVPVCAFSDCGLGMARRTVSLLQRTIARVGVNGVATRVRISIGRTL